MTYTFKTKPDEHQVVALKRALNHRRFGIFFQQRVGKTKVAIDFAGCVWLKDHHCKTLIVCPLSVRSEWESQIAQHYPFKCDVFTYPKTPDKRRELLKKTKDASTPVFLIVNYDLINNDEDFLRPWNPDTVIFDESHLIGHYNSARSRAAARIGEVAKNVLLLTGTPIPKKWYHIFGQFRAMDNRIFGKSWSKFIKEWGVKGGYMGKEITRCTDYEQLSKIIAQHSIRVLRKDVMEEPNVEDVFLTVELSPKTQRVYDDLKKKFMVELTSASVVTADLALTRLMRLQQICGGFITDDDKNVVPVGTEKLDVLEDLVKTRVEGGEKVVVFYRYTAEGKAIVGRLSKIAPVAILNGSVTEEDRKRARDAFQTGESDVIVVQIATGAMGVSLDAAHINVFYSVDFSLSNYLQARDRVMGRNQKSDVTNYFISAKKTVDERVMHVLSHDEDIASKISDSWRWMME